MKEKQLSPQKARTEKQICSLRTDNYSTKDFWICLNGGRQIAIHQQRNGEDSKQKLLIPKKDFNCLIKWYQRTQQTLKRK